MKLLLEPTNRLFLLLDNKVLGLDIPEEGVVVVNLKMGLTRYGRRWRFVSPENFLWGKILSGRCHLRLSLVESQCLSRSTELRTTPRPSTTVRWASSGTVAEMRYAELVLLPNWNNITEIELYRADTFTEARMISRQGFATTGSNSERRDKRERFYTDRMSATKDEDPRIHGISSSIRVVPNFPKPGIMFQDITTLLLDPKAFKNTVDLFVERYKDKNISVVAGVEARGFIFGPPIALAIGAKFVPLRKPRKLPGEVISQKYVLEYGTDCLEMHVGAVQCGDRALVVDDLIATGGTLCAAISLLERVGAEVVECACVIELPELQGRERLNGKPLYILVESR
ncbi:adenine phosphoribosyltransferase 3 isoform X2 [Cinnamomum micranthum f. kanehirae]|uniref:adenine phosphoribosyltransferase n=1 Tax=Cinnamomum micranthum f. kanehirae TaxID=337451 RepID=A0A443PEU8_9MAGN|nr:adenine phosphoribosyltransferase 3 isoform X2 [Cinnamomum micranthum f. kanehirae]